MKKVLCFDIDGVICTTKGSDYANSVPNEAVITQMHVLYCTGHDIKLQTARGMGRTNDKGPPQKIIDLTLAQMRDWDVPYDSIAFGKVSADVYIDDKGFHFLGPDCLTQLTDRTMSEQTTLQLSPEATAQFIFALQSAMLNGTDVSDYLRNVAFIPHDGLLYPNTIEADNDDKVFEDDDSFDDLA